MCHCQSDLTALVAALRPLVAQGHTAQTLGVTVLVAVVIVGMHTTDCSADVLNVICQALQPLKSGSCCIAQTALQLVLSIVINGLHVTQCIPDMLTALKAALQPLATQSYTACPSMCQYSIVMALHISIALPLYQPTSADVSCKIYLCLGAHAHIVHCALI